MFRPIFAAAFAAMLSLPAQAQTSPTQIWPTRPVTMVVPFDFHPQGMPDPRG